jgi:hypothetical protein
VILYIPLSRTSAVPKGVPVLLLFMNGTLVAAGGENFLSGNGTHISI